MIMLFMLFNCSGNLGVKQINEKERYLSASIKAAERPLTKSQSFLGFSLGSTVDEASTHLRELKRNGKIFIHSGYGEYPSVANQNLKAVYVFHFRNGGRIQLNVSFFCTGGRLRSIIGNFNCYSDSVLEKELVTMYEEKLGKSKVFDDSDEATCYYWLDGGQKILLTVPHEKNSLSEQPSVEYSALSMTAKQQQEDNIKWLQDSAENAKRRTQTISDL